MLDQKAITSEHNSDKIVLTPATETVVNSGATNQSPQTALVVEKRIANPYGKACFVRYRWSVDGGANWQGQLGRLNFSFTLTTPGGSGVLPGLQAAVSIGCSDIEIIFRTASGYHGNVSDNGVTYTYTPISQTFLIEYSLFEVG